MSFSSPPTRTDQQDDPTNATDTHGRFLSFRHPGTPPNDQNLDVGTVSPNLTIDETSPYILTHTPSAFQRMIEANYSYGFESDEGKLKENNDDHRKWSNPLEVQYVLLFHVPSYRSTSFVNDWTLIAYLLARRRVFEDHLETCSLYNSGI
jgi:hypothetical protein